MLKRFITIIFCLQLSVSAFSTANSVYHEFTMNTVGAGCGTFVNNLTPGSGAGLTVQFSIDYQYFTNQARIYYTTDGSAPSAVRGVLSGTTQQVVASYVCTFNNGTGIVDVAQGTIPAFPVGTVVKYIVSAWHSGGGLEIFASGGSNTTAASADVFTYTVISALPISVTGFSAKKENSAIRLTWSAVKELNTSRFEIYSSDNGIAFKNIGYKKINDNLSADYNFIDANPVNGINFYKIKIIDKDGLFFYTPVIKQLYESATPVSISASGSVLRVRFSSPRNEPFIVSMMNSSGQVMKKWTITGSSSTTAYDLDLPQRIQMGIHHIVIRGMENVYSWTLLIR